MKIHAKKKRLFKNIKTVINRQLVIHATQLVEYFFKRILLIDAKMFHAIAMMIAH